MAEFVTCSNWVTEKIFFLHNVIIRVHKAKPPFESVEEFGIPSCMATGLSCQKIISY